MLYSAYQNDGTGNINAICGENIYLSIIIFVSEESPFFKLSYSITIFKIKEEENEIPNRMCF